MDYGYLKRQRAATPKQVHHQVLVACNTIESGGARSQVGTYDEGRNDLLIPPVNDTGTYLLKVTANEADCESSYLLRVGYFD